MIIIISSVFAWKKFRNFSANDEKCTKYSHYTKVINSVAITIEDRIHRMLYEKYTDIKYFSVSCLWRQSEHFPKSKLCPY